MEENLLCLLLGQTRENGVRLLKIMILFKERLIRKLKCLNTFLLFRPCSVCCSKTSGQRFWHDHPLEHWKQSCRWVTGCLGDRLHSQIAAILAYYSRTVRIFKADSHRNKHFFQWGEIWLQPPPNSIKPLAHRSQKPHLLGWNAIVSRFDHEDSSGCPKS